MFDIKINISVPNFEKYPIEIDCPKCKLSSWTTIGHVKRRDYLICRGCHSNILLEDYENKMHRMLKKLNKTFKLWENIF